MAAVDPEKILRALKGVDWPRALHRGALLVRVMRGDRDVATDHQREQSRAAAAKRTIDAMARAAVGCARTPDCDCPLCNEARGDGGGWP